ncbi:MAG: molybdenum cofactor guanylyltransferase [Bacteroidota bacterium]
MNSTNTPILLIACGGNSLRMGSDKSQLNYHGKPQFLHLYEIAQPHFPEIYFSIQEKQEATFSAFPNVIVDSEKFAGHGPVSGLLSCHEKFRERSVLLIGCDYPFLTIDDILKLNSEKDQTCSFYINLYEPLLTYYSKTSLDRIEDEFNSGQYALQDFLRRNSIKKITPDSPLRIKSVDTHEEYLIALKKITGTPGKND